MAKAWKSDKEILFRSPIEGTARGEVLLIKKGKKFIVNVFNLTGQFTAQCEYFDDPEQAYYFYESVLNSRKNIY